MGTRMSVKIKGTDEWFGDDHKLYGYVSYEDVRRSFDQLYPYMREQWKDDFGSYEDFGEPEKEYYDLICAIENTPELEIDADSFRVFAKDYIEDFANRDSIHMAKPDEDFVKRVSGYMNKLADDPRPKILEWG